MSHYTLEDPRECWDSKILQAKIPATISNAIPYTIGQGVASINLFRARVPEGKKPFKAAIVGRKQGRILSDWQDFGLRAGLDLLAYVVLIVVCAENGDIISTRDEERSRHVFSCQGV